MDNNIFYNAVRPTIVNLSFISLLTLCSCGNVNIDGSTDASNDYYYPDIGIDNIFIEEYEEGSNPFCYTTDNVIWSYDIWAYSSYIFASIASYEGIRWHNAIVKYDGSGWTIFAESNGDYVVMDAPITNLQGANEGLLFGWDRDSGSPLMKIEEASISQDLFWLIDLFVENESRALAIVDGDPQLIFWDGVSWEPFTGSPLPYRVWRVWANDEIIVCGGDNGIILIYSGDEWIPQDTGVVSGISQIWGLSSNDIWASTFYPYYLLRYDGVSWEIMTIPSTGDPDEDCRGAEILSMWGINEAMFFNTSNDLFEYTDGDFISLMQLDCIRETDYYINTIWGTSEQSLYISVISTDPTEERCSGHYILWWDGTSFWWL